MIVSQVQKPISIDVGDEDDKTVLIVQGGTCTVLRDRER